MTVTVINTPDLLALNASSVKAGRNRNLRDDVPLDPEGTHVVNFQMIHNDREMRLGLMLKLIDREEPAQGWLDISFDEARGLAQIERDEDGEWQRVTQWQRVNP